MNRLRSLLRTRRFAVALVVGLTLLGGAAGWAIELARGPLYEVRADVQVRFWALETYLLTGQAVQVTGVDLADVARITSSPSVLSAVADRLGEQQDRDLADAVTATAQLTTNAVEITATAEDAESALQLSDAVTTELINTVDERLRSASASLQDSADEEVAAIVAQRAQVLASTVQPLTALGGSDAERIAPAPATPVALALVGLAAGTLLVILLQVGRPRVGDARSVQRMLDVPAVPFGEPSGDAAVARLVRELVEARPSGRLLVVPATASAEKAAIRFADWAREHIGSLADAERLFTAPDPATAVLRRSNDGEVAAVLLLAESSGWRRDLVDADALLKSWHPADAAVVITP